MHSLVLQNYTHPPMLGKEISIMNLGEAPKRMHDPKSYLANLFAHERANFHYVYEDDPDDSMLRTAVDFREAMGKIEDPKVQFHLYKYQKDIKDRTLHYRETKLKIQHDLQKQNMKKEAKEQATIFVVALATESKDKGKGVLDGPSII